MPPNIVDIPTHEDPENAFDNSKASLKPSQLEQGSEDSYSFKIFQSVLNLLVHILIGATVSYAVFFAVRSGLPLGATPMHILLCVVGYQLLMAQAILSLSPHNTWTTNLRLVHKRRVHWILQIVGSILAIIGSFIKILDKTVNWDTLHGQFALVALVFTTVSLINGLASLYAYELRKVIPSNLSKLTHICFGTVAFAAASISLCYGFDKNSFRNWATTDVAYTVIAFTAIFTFIIIVNPLIVFFRKSVNIVTNGIIGTLAPSHVGCVNIIEKVKMPPNIGDPPMEDPESAHHSSKNTPTAPPPISRFNYWLNLLQSLLNFLAHLLIGATVGIAVTFAFRNGFPLEATPLHIVLCVIGYHLLMAQAILSLSPFNSWSARLRLVHKRRTHWILQVLGSGLAIVGSFIKMLDKTTNFDTLHGKFALVALVFTSVSLFNGLASLYAHELRNKIPSILSKLTHICFGIVAFIAAVVCLCYGFDKNSFRNWAGDELAYAVIAFTATYACIIIITPLITFFQKSLTAVRNRF